jgi:Domain of unknown function (DUF4160)
MPIIFRRGGLRFFFYSDEGTPREPPHIHVRQAGSEAKLWLRPGLPEAYNYGFSTGELREIRELIEANREQIETSWNEFFD